jgi:hypothetical protein
MTTLFIITTIIAATTIIGIGVTPTLVQQQTFAVTIPILAKHNAPIATSGNNIYIAWWTNNTGNDEVLFRASTDGGKTFGDKINLSNTTKSESQDAHIDASGDRVFVTWWERNATSEEPLLRTSTDMGATFSPIMKLSTNGTVGSSGGG